MKSLRMLMTLSLAGLLATGCIVESGGNGNGNGSGGGAGPGVPTPNAVAAVDEAQSPLDLAAALRVHLRRLADELYQHQALAEDALEMPGVADVACDGEEGGCVPSRRAADEGIDELVDFLERDLFGPESVESRSTHEVVFRVRPALLCEDEDEGCRRALTEVPVLIHLTSPGAGDFDLVFEVAGARPLHVFVYGNRVGARVDLGAALQAAKDMAAVDGEQFDGELSGVVTVVLGVSEALTLTATIDQAVRLRAGREVSVDVAPSRAVLTLTEGRMLLDLATGAASSAAAESLMGDEEATCAVSPDGEVECERVGPSAEGPGRTLAVEIPAITATAEATEAALKLEAAAATLRATLDGAELLRATVADFELLVADETVHAPRGFQVDVVAQPSLLDADAPSRFDLSAGADANTAVRGAEAGLRVERGRVWVRSQSEGVDVSVTAGQCLGGPEAQAGEDEWDDEEPGLQDLRAVACL